MAYKLDEFDIEILNKTPEGQKYLEYYDKFKSEPFPLGTAMPDIDLLYGGIIGLYDECIKQNKTWKQLLGSGWDEIIGLEELE